VCAFGNIAANTSELKIEQRVNMKFLAKLNKTAVESYRMLSVYRELVFLNGINGFVVEERTLQTMIVPQAVLSHL